MEIINERLLYPSYEIIGGEKIMAPAPNPTQGGVIMRLGMIIAAHFDETDGGYVLGDNADVHFPDGTILRPDLSVILEKNAAIINWSSGIYGVPDMVVEVLSKSTRKNDLTIKKDIYEAQGVREYWIIDPWAKIIDVYLLRDGKYFFDDEYILFDENKDKNDLEIIHDRGELDLIKHEIPVKILDGLTIPLKRIFKWGYE